VAYERGRQAFHVDELEEGRSLQCKVRPNEDEPESCLTALFLILESHGSSILCPVSKERSWHGLDTDMGRNDLTCQFGIYNHLCGGTVGWFHLSISYSSPLVLSASPVATDCHPVLLVLSPLRIYVSLLPVNSAPPRAMGNPMCSARRARYQQVTSRVWFVRANAGNKFTSRTIANTRRMKVMTAAAKTNQIVCAKINRSGCGL